MIAIVATLLVALCLVLAAVLVVLKRRNAKSDAAHAQPETVAAVRRGGAAGRAARLRRRLPAGAGANVNDEDGDDDQDVDEDDDSPEEAAVGKSRAARLAARKAAKKAAKEEQRAAREEQRAAQQEGGEQRAAPRSAYEEGRRQKEREREEAEAAQEEEIRRAQAERQQREAEEFEAWRGAINVDESGEAAASQAQENELLAALTEYIVSRKVVAFEELSAEFKMRAKDAVERIKTLEDTGKLTGIMDDRGKYIYLSAEELQSVADHIRTKGRISISHLATTASKLLDLEGKDVNSSSLRTADIPLDDLVEE